MSQETPLRIATVHWDLEPTLTPPSRRRAEAALWRAAKAERGTDRTRTNARTHLGGSRVTQKWSRHDN